MSDRQMPTAESIEHERERPLRVRRCIRQLIELLKKPDGFSGSHAAQLLFTAIYEAKGERVARQIFAKLGKPPSPRQQAELANYRLLDRYDMMRLPNIMQLARELEEENKSLPPSQRRGAGGIDRSNLEAQIKRARKRRDRAIAAGTWFGPMPR